MIVFSLVYFASTIKRDRLLICQKLIIIMIKPQSHIESFTDALGLTFAEGLFDQGLTGNTCFF